MNRPSELAQRIAREQPYSADTVQAVLDVLDNCEECTKIALSSHAAGVSPILVCVHREGFLQDQLKEHVSNAVLLSETPPHHNID